MNLKIRHGAVSFAMRNLKSRPILLIFIFGLALVSTIALLTVVLLANLRESAISEKKIELQNLALVISEQMDRSLQAVDLVQKNVLVQLNAEFISTPEEFAEKISRHETHVKLQSAISGLPHIDALTVISNGGQLLNYSRAWPVPPIDISDRAYYRAFTENSALEYLLSEPVQNRGSGTWTVYYARKVSNKEGRFLGLILGAVELRYFEALFERVSTHKSLSLALIRRDGLLLARYPNPSNSTGMSLAANTQFRELLKHANGGAVRITSLVDGQDRLFAAYTLPNFPLLISVGSTMENVLASWRTSSIYFSLIAVLLSLAIGGLVGLIGFQVWKNLKAQHLQLDTALSNMPQGLCMFDRDRRLTVCNKRYAELYGLAQEETRPGVSIEAIIERRVERGHIDGDIEQYRISRLQEISRSEPYQVVNRLADGRFVSVVHRPMIGGGWVATHEDITEAKQKDDSFRLMFEKNPIPMWVFDRATLRFLAVNDAAVAHYGYSRQQFGQMTVVDLRVPEEREGSQAFFRELPVAQFNEYVGRHLKADGSTIEINVYSRSLTYEGCSAQLVAIHDITESRKAHASVRRLADFDTLTRLPNRATFNASLEAAIVKAKESGQSFAILSIDLDRFKAANDTYGHLFGDALLKAAAGRLQREAPDCLVARMGGDEFNIITPLARNEIHLSDLSTRLLKAFDSDFEIDGTIVSVGISIGGAVYPTHGDLTETLLTNADAALYRAKSVSKGCAVFFEPAMCEQVRERNAIQVDLKFALAWKELSLHYQPQFNVDGTATGFEALLRWTHPKRGCVSPAVFIPIAEESGIIDEIGEWVLRQACLDAIKWENPMTVAVNISPSQFRRGDLPALVHTVLLETGLPASRLEIEITEGVFIHDFSRAVSILRRLKALGVKIALDDFGTGYSSLSYLHSFAFDKIKIDQAFVQDLETNRHSLAIVRAVMGLSKSLGVPVIAEGVETEAQFSLLVQEGCDEVQGFLFGKPAPIENFHNLHGQTAQNDLPISAGPRARASNA